MSAKIIFIVITLIIVYCAPFQVDETAGCLRFRAVPGSGVGLTKQSVVDDLTLDTRRWRIILVKQCFQ